MRVIAGQWRGRRLVAPTRGVTRPTSDRVREAIFSAVYSRFGDVSGARALDLYAGSGAMGIEALSRGASHVTFVERDPRALRALRANLRSLGVAASRFTVESSDVADLAHRKGLAPVSLLFADPPYRIEPAEVWQVLEGLASAGLLEARCLLVYEHSARLDATLSQRFVLDAVKRYGDTAVMFATYEG